MRRYAALTLLAILALLGIDWRLVRLPVSDREPVRRHFEQYADRDPRFPRFLESVRARTKRGDTIAIVMPPMTSPSDHEYAYYRASYLLAGRRVLPVVTSDGARHPENLRRAQYIAIWRGGDGVLVQP